MIITVANNGWFIFKPFTNNFGRPGSNFLNISVDVEDLFFEKKKERKNKQTINNLEIKILW